LPIPAAPNLSFATKTENGKGGGAAHHADLGVLGQEKRPPGEMMLSVLGGRASASLMTTGVARKKEREAVVIGQTAARHPLEVACTAA
jgi:hypothetical protein